MSKELEIIKNRNEKIKSNHMIGNRRIANEELKECSIAIENAILEIEESLTPPTEEEVCKALSEYLKRTVVYDDVLNMFVEVKGGRARGRIIARLRVNKINIPHDLPPRLITMIGRFYEGKAEWKNKEHLKKQ